MTKTVNTKMSDQGRPYWPSLKQYLNADKIWMAMQFPRLKNELNRAKTTYSVRNLDEKVKLLWRLVTLFTILAATIYASLGYHGGFVWLHGLTSKLPDAFLQTLTFTGDSYVALALMLLVVRRIPAAASIAFLAALIGTLITQSLKGYFAILRPASVLPQSELTIIGEAVYLGSFPSGHSLTIFIFATTLWLFSRRTSLQIGLMLLATAVAFSRVAVGAHWPIDVLVGSALGITSTIIASYAIQHLRFGFNRLGHGLLVSIFLIAAITLFHHDGGYPLAQPFATFVAVISIGAFVRDYLWRRPLRRNEPAFS